MRYIPVLTKLVDDDWKLECIICRYVETNRIIHTHIGDITIDVNDDSHRDIRFDISKQDKFALQYTMLDHGIH